MATKKIDPTQPSFLAKRFRGFLPVVIDVETAGFDAAKDALLEIAAVTVATNEHQKWCVDEVFNEHIQPFEGANLNAASLKFNGIDPGHPFRQQIAKSESDALVSIFKPIRKKIKEYDCKRAILVGHNAHFDLSFLNAAVNRCQIKHNPFHLFSVFDTVTMAGITYGQTVLSRAVKAAGIEFDDQKAHSARYDAKQTALLFCHIVNQWDDYSGLFRA